LLKYNQLKSFLFKLDPENAHHLAELFLKSLDYLPFINNKMSEENFIIDDRLKQKIFDTTFLNPVGLAAGFDKNGSMIKSMPSLGFGYTEVGTITPKPQDGNPKPRLFRHVEEKSLQNAMGFNNKGMLQMERNLKKVIPFVLPVGVNIGKNKTTSDRDAIDDYLKLIKALHSYSSYLVINISSPNTPGLRDLQNENFIKHLFIEAKKLTNKPILLKIAPDMQPNQAIDLCSLAVEYGANGIIATNTTIDYSLVKRPKSVGGISGAVLKDKSFEIFDAIAKELYKKTTLISVGGIDSADEAYKRIKAGASLVQVYSALIFEGPKLVHDINVGLTKLLQQDGFKHISEAIGANR